MTAPLRTMPRSVQAHESARAEVIRHLLAWIAVSWPVNKPADPQAWFQRFADAYADVVTLAQLEAAVLAEWSVDDALRHQGVTPEPWEAGNNPMSFASVDGVGRPVMGQAYAAAGMVGGAIAGAAESGGDVAVALSQAWRSAGMSLAVASQTMVSDASRAAKSTRMVTRDVGYVRVLTPPSCSRCAVLAGKFFRNPTAGFRRHPGCDCTQMPVKNRRHESVNGLFYDAQDYFDSLSTEAQDKIFTKAGAQAIRDGADINQVVNARRGMTTASQAPGGRREVTTEGTTKRGWAAQYLRPAYQAKLRKQPGSRYRVLDRPRLTPDRIYRIADGDVDVARMLLHQNGYYLDASPRLDSARALYRFDRDLALATERARAKLRARGVRPPT